MKIKQIYIDQSKKIIDNYNTVINMLLAQEKNLQENKAFVLKLQKKIENVDMSTDDPLIKQQKLEKMLVQYDIKINKLEQDIKPILEKMEELKKHSKIVYDKILTEYSAYSEAEIQEQIKKQLQE